MPGLEGRTLGRYEIVGLVGSGGMGEVFRARDTQLGRDVAVKVISSKVAQSTKAIDRFEREAKTVAQLSHPNILDIHDFGRDAGFVYAVTELLEGSDLRVRMRGSMLPLSKAAEIGIAVANGLSAAHSKAIVHRDIKPENVFVTSTGQVKILDFGIAGLKTGSALESPDSGVQTESLTGTGDVVGTVGYMSPEQVRGENLDQRSDIFALGCLLYEMLTGERAFRGETAHATAMAILNRDPDPITNYRSDIPPGMEVLVRRCLEKQPDERFESARDVAFAIQAISGTRSAVDPPPPQSMIFGIRRSIIAGVAAVFLVVSASVLWTTMMTNRAPPPLPSQIKLGLLPIDVNGANPDLAAFGSGIIEELAKDLAVVEQELDEIAWVVPSDQTRASGVSTAGDFHRTFAVTLAVASRLESNDGRVRLSLSLVDPSTGQALRETTIEDVAGNVDSFQHGPVIAVTNMLGVDVNQQTLDRLQASGTTLMSAFESYLRGCGILTVVSGEQEARSASDLFESAVSDDPLFESGWVARANSRLAEFQHGGRVEPALLDEGLIFAEKALAMGGRPENAQAVIGRIHAAASRMEAAVTALEKSVGSAPRDAELHLALADFYQRAGNLPAAEAQLQHANYLRPEYWVGYDRLAKLYLAQGKLEASAVEFRHLIDCAPDSAINYVKLGGIEYYLDRLDSAQRLFEQSIAIEPNFHALENLGSIYFQESRFSDAAEMYESALELQDEDYTLWGNLAYAYRYGPQPEKAEPAFRRAIELAEDARRAAPDDLQAAISLAGYLPMVGNTDRGRVIIEEVIAAEPTEPLLFSQIAEAFEDLDDREQALEWVRRSFEAGASRNRFEGRPTLREFVADERYQALVQEYFGAT